MRDISGWIKAVAWELQTRAEAGLKSASIKLSHSLCRAELPELIGDLVDSCLGAGFVAGLAVPAHADGPDGIVTHVDWNPAAERDHLGEQALTGRVLAGFGGLRPFQRRAAERPRRIGLAPSQFQTMRRGIVG